MGFWNIKDNASDFRHDKKRLKEINESIADYKQRRERLSELTTAHLNDTDQKFVVARDKVIEALTNIHDLMPELSDASKANIKPDHLDGLNLSLQTPDSTTQREPTFMGGAAIKAATGPLAALTAYGSVGVLGTASTGTAIASLHGVVATNATLAWFGGGALAAGGGGIALGLSALSSVAMVPAVFACAEYVSKKYKNLVEKAVAVQEQEASAFDEIKKACSHWEMVCERVKTKTDLLTYCLERIERYKSMIRDSDKSNRSSEAPASKERNRQIVMGCTHSVSQIKSVVVNVLMHPILDEGLMLAAPKKFVLEEIDPGIIVNEWAI